MSLMSTLESAAGPHAWTKDAPSDKALGKRKMTELQLKSYYAKQPKMDTDYDSDDGGQRPMSTIYSHNPYHPHNNFNLQLALETRRNQENTAPVNVAAEDEHARDLLEALHGRYSPIEQSESVVDINPDDISDLITEAEQEAQSQRLVADPFNPHESPHMTAEERDSVVKGEQMYRMAHGLPLLLRSEDDQDHWIEPTLTVIKLEQTEIEVTPLLALSVPTDEELYS